MKKNTKLTKGLCMLLAVVMAFGCSLAYFTDYASTQANGTAGTVAVSMDSNINLLDADGKDIINPGDMRDGSFTVTNEGNKSIDVRTTIALTTQSNTGLDLSFSGSATEQSEYDLYLRSDVELVEGYGYQPKEGAQPLQVKSIDKDVITYVLPEYSLNGNSDKYDEVETIDGVTAFSQTNDFVFVMKGGAGNEWQNSAVSIDVIVEAKQHENTAAGWDIVAQESVQVGSIDKSVVKGEVNITEIEGANKPVTYIPVISKNENGEDLNATSSLIEGEEKEDLLYSLEQSGMANAEDVDLLIDVKSDDFDGMADTTFDVSEIAEDGDTAVIMHYDETKGEWEYIATETVVDGKVNGDFSSYSPVAIQIIKKPVEGEGTDTPDEEEENRNITLKVIDANGQEVNNTNVGITNGVIGTAFYNGIPVDNLPDGTYEVYLVTLPDNTQIWPDEGSGAQNMEWLKTKTVTIAGDGEYTIELNHVVSPYTIIHVVNEDGTPADVPDNASLSLYTDDYSNYMFMSQDLSRTRENGNATFIAPSIDGTYNNIEFGGFVCDIVTSQITVSGQTEVNLVVSEPTLYNVTFNLTNNSSTVADAFDVYIGSTKYSISDGTIIQLPALQEGYVYDMWAIDYVIEPASFTVIDSDVTVDLVVSDGNTLYVSYDTSLNVDARNAMLINNETGACFTAVDTLDGASVFRNVPAGSYTVQTPNWYNPGTDEATGSLEFDGVNTNLTVVVTAP